MLVLALCSGTEVAAEAFKVIAILLSHADLPAEQVDAAEAQLVRMQAVPWLCLLLKPDMRQQEGVVSTGYTEDALGGCPALHVAS